jgi:hypothetical protein
MSRMINLSAMYSSKCKLENNSNALPVKVDLDWLGKTLLSPNKGIIPSREAEKEMIASKDDNTDRVVL